MEERWGLRGYKRGNELVQSTLYTSMEISQWNHLILLMCANKNYHMDGWIDG
jgi:hypothetical protein